MRKVIIACLLSVVPLEFKAIAAETTSVSLHIAVLDKKVLPFQQIRVVVTLRSNSSAPVSLEGESVASDVIICYGEKGKPFMELSKPIADSRIRGSKSDLMPDKEIRWIHTLHYSLAPERSDSSLRFVAPYPGNFRIQACLPQGTSKKKLQSNIATYRVAIPGSNNRKAYEYIRENISSDPEYIGYVRGSMRMLFYLTTSSNHNEGQLQRDIHETVVSEWSQSDYATWFYYHLGRRALTPRNKTPENEEKGVEYLEIVASRKDRSYSPKALLELAKYTINTGDIDGTIELLQELKKKYPTSDQALEHCTTWLHNLEVSRKEKQSKK